MLEEGTPLVQGRASRRTNYVLASVAGLAAVVCVALCVFAVATNKAHTVALDSTMSVNCDGSVDITTDILAPCMPMMMPPATTMVTTTTAPSWAPPAVMPPPMPVAAAPFAPPPVYQVGPNAYQLPTVWSGDHVLSGGQPEWAAEDAAQHALNLANWRIKLLQAKKKQARLSNEVLNTQADTDLDGKADLAQASPVSLQSGNDATAELGEIKKNMVVLARDTTKALGDLKEEVDEDKRSGKKARADTLKNLKSDTDAELSRVMKELDEVTSKSAEAEADDKAEYFDE